MVLVIAGRIVPMSRADPSAVFAGRIYLGDDGFAEAFTSQAFGALQSGHYVFPACETAQIDPTRPQTTWRTSWRHLTRVIACPVCKRLQNPADECSNPECQAPIKGVRSPLVGLRFHDLRHHAITELAESQASDATVMSIAGHVSPKMLQLYSHVRLQAKRTALDSLSMGRPAVNDSEGRMGGYGTKMPNTEVSGWQLVDSLVELSGIEPLTSSLRTSQSPTLHAVRSILSMA